MGENLINLKHALFDSDPQSPVAFRNRHVYNMSVQPSLKYAFCTARPPTCINWRFLILQADSGDSDAQSEQSLVGALAVCGFIMHWLE